MPFNPETKKIGDLVKSQDWNDATTEIVRLEKDKVNRSGNDTIKGPLTIEGTLSAKDGTVSGNLSVSGNVGIGTSNPQNKLHVVGDLVLGNNTNGQKFLFHSRIGDLKGDFLQITYDDSKGIGDWNQGITLKRGGNVGIGTTSPKAKLDVSGNAVISGNVGIGTTDPKAKLDILSSATRTGTHPQAVKGLYITGDFGETDGVEFRKSDGTQGIGFGLNTIYAAGSSANQDLGLKAKGTGEVKVTGKLSVTSDLIVTGTVNGRNISTDGFKLDNHTHNGADSQKVRHSDLNLDGGTNPHKTTAADVGALSISGGTVSGDLKVNGAITPSVGATENNGIMFPKNPGGGSGDAAWIRYYVREGEATTLEIGTSNDSNDHIALMPNAGNVGIGRNNPVAKLDIASDIRTGTHPTAVKGLYITGDFSADSDGVEFRHSNGTQGIGFGHNTIYAAGTNANQDLGLKAKGTGEVKVTGKLSVTSDLTLERKIKPNNTDKRLHVIGDLVLGNDTNGQKFIFHSRTSNSGNFLQITNDLADGTWDWNEKVGGGGGITLQRGGNVGIGTQSPTAKLDVRGDVSVSGKITVNGNDISKPPTLTADAVGALSNKGGTVSGDLSVTGSVSFGSTIRQMLNLWYTSYGIGIQTNTQYFRTGSNFAWYKGGSHNDSELNAGGGTSLMTLDGSGNLRIGTTDPNKGKLHIEGFVNYMDSRKYRWFSFTTASNTASVTYSSPYSLYASNHIGCTEFNAFSDLRIKEIKGTSDSQADLETLLQIQVTDYHYKDKIAKGNRPKKKVIGQQIADVYPQAVSTHVDVVPDIFESAIIEENWVTLNSHNLKIGDKVKIFWNDDDSQLFTVEAIEPDKFKIPLDHTGDIFVYGREVDDFHVVDYDALSMLHISATQQLYKIIKKLEQKLNEKIKD